MEKFKSTDFSVFNLWKIQQVKKEDLKKSTIEKQLQKE